MSFTEIVHYMGIVQQTTACGLPWGPGKGRWSDHMPQVTCERCRAVDVSRPKPAGPERRYAEARARVVSRDFLGDLAAVLNRHSIENGSNTPDFILAGVLMRCLEAWNQGIFERENWYGRRERPGASEPTQFRPDNEILKAELARADRAIAGTAEMVEREREISAREFASGPVKPEGKVEITVEDLKTAFRRGLRSDLPWHEADQAATEYVERVLREKGNKVERVHAERGDRLCTVCKTPYPCETVINMNTVVPDAAHEREVWLAAYGRLALAELQVYLRHSTLSGPAFVQNLLNRAQASPFCPGELREATNTGRFRELTEAQATIARLRELLRWAFDVGELGIYEDMSRRYVGTSGRMWFHWLCRGCGKGIVAMSGDARHLERQFEHAEGCRYKAARDELDAAFPLGQSAEEAEQEAQAAIASLHEASGGQAHVAAELAAVVHLSARLENLPIVNHAVCGASGAWLRTAPTEDGGITCPPCLEVIRKRRAAVRP